MAELAADGCKEGGCRFAGWTTGKVGASKEGRGRRQKLNRSLVRVSRTSLSGSKQGGSLASDRRLGGNSGGPSADATGGGDRRRIHSRRRQSISESNLPACLHACLPASSTPTPLGESPPYDLMYENGRELRGSRPCVATARKKSEAKQISKVRIIPTSIKLNKGNVENYWGGKFA